MTCQKFGGKPSERFGILDDAAAYDFDQAAAWVLQVAEDKKAIALLKAQVGATWGTGGGDGPEDNGDDLQQKAHEFFN